MEILKDLLHEWNLKKERAYIALLYDVIQQENILMYNWAMNMCKYKLHM